jgi:hypothetical protein
MQVLAEVSARRALEERASREAEENPSDQEVEVEMQHVEDAVLPDPPSQSQSKSPHKSPKK